MYNKVISFSDAIAYGTSGARTWTIERTDSDSYRVAFYTKLTLTAKREVRSREDADRLVKETL